MMADPATLIRKCLALAADERGEANTREVARGRALALIAKHGLRHIDFGIDAMGQPAPKAAAARPGRVRVGDGGEDFLRRATRDMERDIMAAFQASFRTWATSTAGTSKDMFDLEKLREERVKAAADQWPNEFRERYPPRPFFYTGMHPAEGADEGVTFTWNDGGPEPTDPNKA